MPIKIVAADGAHRTEFATEFGPDDIAEMKLEAAAVVGDRVWSVTFGPHEVAGIHHDEVTLPVQTRIRPQAISLAVWSIPSPVVAEARFAIEVGAKSSAGTALAAEHVEVHDESGEVVSVGYLGEAPYPGTTALYWTIIELVAPPREGLRTWSAEFEPRDSDLPHERMSTTFSIPPQHRLTIKVIESDTTTPIADAQVRHGPYRATTDPLGLAEIDAFMISASGRSATRQPLTATSPRTLPSSSLSDWGLISMCQQFCRRLSG
jgi:hypothetical protein